MMAAGRSSMRLVLLLLVAPFMVHATYTACVSQTIKADRRIFREDLVAAGGSCELTLTFDYGTLLSFTIFNSTGGNGTIAFTSSTGNTITYETSESVPAVYVPAPRATVTLMAALDTSFYADWGLHPVDQRTHAVNTTELLSDSDPNIYRTGSDLNNKLTVIRGVERILFYPLKDPDYDYDFFGYSEPLTGTIIYDGEGVTGTALASLYEMFTNPRPWYQSTQNAITILDLDDDYVKRFSFMFTLHSTVADPGAYSILPYGRNLISNGFFPIQMDTSQGYNVYSIYSTSTPGLYLSSLEVPTGVGKDIEVYAGGPPTTTSVTQYHLFSFSETTAALWNDTNLNMPMVTFVLPAGANVTVGLSRSQVSSSYGSTNGSGIYMTANYPSLSTSTDDTMQKIDFLDTTRSYDKKPAFATFTFTVDSIDDSGKLSLLVNNTEILYDSSQRGHPTTLTVYDTMNISYKAPPTAHRGVLVHYDVFIHPNAGTLYFLQSYVFLVVAVLYSSYC